jgi:hypothetical protein
VSAVTITVQIPRGALFQFQRGRPEERFQSTVAIATSIINAVRLARNDNISPPSPSLATVTADSAGLGKTILKQAVE